MSEQGSQQPKNHMDRVVDGATSLALLSVFLLFAALPMVLLSEKMTGWLQVTGLLLLSLFTAFILMLFFTGLVKALVRFLFTIFSSEYRSHNQN
jgi:hypothetical protein